MDEFIEHSWRKACDDMTVAMNQLCGTRFWEIFLTPWRVYYRFMRYSELCESEKFLFNLMTKRTAQDKSDG